MVQGFESWPADETNVRVRRVACAGMAGRTAASASAPAMKIERVTGSPLLVAQCARTPAGKSNSGRVRREVADIEDHTTGGGPVECLPRASSDLYCGAAVPVKPVPAEP